MVAEMLAPHLVPERGWRGPGCDERCTVVKAIVTGVFGRSELLLHDPDAHEAYGRGLAGLSVVDNRIVETGRIAIDLGRMSASVDGRPAALTATEIRLLVVLARRIGLTVHLEDVVDLVWGEAYLQSPRPSWRHLLRVTLTRLRSRLGPAGDLIVTVRNIGLRLETVAPGEDAASQGRRSIARGRWALEWDACRRCGRTDRCHNAHGYCSSCHNRAVRHGLEPYGRK